MIKHSWNDLFAFYEYEIFVENNLSFHIKNICTQEKFICVELRANLQSFKSLINPLSSNLHGIRAFKFISARLSTTKIISFNQKENFQKLNLHTEAPHKNKTTRKSQKCLKTTSVYSEHLISRTVPSNTRSYTLVKITL